MPFENLEDAKDKVVEKSEAVDFKERNDSRYDTLITNAINSTKGDSVTVDIFRDGGPSEKLMESLRQKGYVVKVEPGRILISWKK